MEVLEQQAEFADIMSCQPQVALERISKKEAQGGRLSYTLIIRGEPKLPDLWHKRDGYFRPKDFIREITIGQPGQAHIVNGILNITMRLLEDALTTYGVLDGAYWDGCHLRVEIFVHIGMQTGSLLGPSNKRQGPQIQITSDQLRHPRTQSTPTRRPPSRAFSFQSGMPMRMKVIEIPGLSHGINPQEHVWNRLSSLSDETCTNYMCPMVAGMSEPLSACGTPSTTSSQSPRLLTQTTSSPPTNMYQSTPPLSATPIGSFQAHRSIESCSSSPAMSSSRFHRPIIDGSLKGLE